MAGVEEGRFQKLAANFGIPRVAGLKELRRIDDEHQYSPHKWGLNVEPECL